MAVLSSSIQDLIVRIVHVLAICCSSFILFSYFRFKDLRGPGFTLVMFLSTSDAILNAIALFQSSGVDGSLSCMVQAIALSFFWCASVLWSLVISVTIYSTVLSALNRPRRSLQYIINRPVLIHLAVWSLSMTLALLPLTTNSAGYHQKELNYCWLRLETFWDWFWVYSTTYGLVWIVVCIALFIACRIRWEIQAVTSLVTENEFLQRSLEGGEGRGAQNYSSHKKLLAFYNSLKWYPIILIVAWTPSTLIRILTVLDVSLPATVLDLFKFLTGILLQGILNAVAYGFTPAVRQKWGELFGRVAITRSLFLVLQFEGSLSEVIRESFVMGGPDSLLTGKDIEQIAYTDNPRASHVELRRLSQNPLPLPASG